MFYAKNSKSMVNAVCSSGFSMSGDKPDNKPTYATEKYASPWLSGGKKGVKKSDNPTAITYTWFLDRLSGIFLNEQKKDSHLEKMGDGPDDQESPIDE